MELGLITCAALAAALITDFLLKAADALYARYPNLLIRPVPAGRPRVRYAALYLALTGMSALLLLRQPTSPAFAAAWLPSLFVLFIILTDYEQRLIFNRALLGLALIALLFTPWIEATLVSRALAAFLGGGVMLALSAASRGGIGGGDIKLLFVLGLWQGPDDLIFLLAFGFLTGGGAAALLLLTGRKKRRDYLAYGPYFAFGALLNLLR